MSERVQSKIACSHPGKFGDAIYGTAAIKWVAGVHHCAVDFYTSSYLASLERLYMYQTWINDFIVPAGYVIRDHGCGTQPAQMAQFMKPGYEAIYEFGFRSFPDRPLPEFVLHQLGIDGINPPMLGLFDYPELIPAPWHVAEYEPDKYVFEEDFIVVAPRSDLTVGPGGVTMKEIFYEFAEKCPLPIVQIGGRGEAWPWENSIDITTLDWLETVSWLSRAKGFYGIISSQGGLAHNFDFPKVYPHNDGGWDMRHVVRTPTSFYEIMPRGDRVLELLGLR